MMTTIIPPKAQSADRFIDCQEALEASVQEVIANAAIAGWTPPEAMAAIIAIAENLSLGFTENEELNAILGQIRKPD
jgi:phage tail tape-measure protein